MIRNFVGWHTRIGHTNHDFRVSNVTIKVICIDSNILCFFLDNNNTKISKYIILTLHGVDTIADIYVNSEKVGTVNNMFVRYRFDMKSRLVRGVSTIAVNI